MLSPSGELPQGVVIGYLFQSRFANQNDSIDIRRIDFAGGAIIEYDRRKHLLSAQLPSGVKAVLVAYGGIAITGDVMVSGRLEI